MAKKLFGTFYVPVTETPSKTYVFDGSYPLSYARKEVDTELKETASSEKAMAKILKGFAKAYKASGDGWEQYLEYDPNQTGQPVALEVESGQRTGWAYIVHEVVA